jgi:hypothetical protein
MMCDECKLVLRKIERWILYQRTEPAEIGILHGQLGCCCEMGETFLLSPDTMTSLSQLGFITHLMVAYTRSLIRIDAGMNSEATIATRTLKSGDFIFKRNTATDSRCCSRTSPLYNDVIVPIRICPSHTLDASNVWLTSQ